DMSRVHRERWRGQKYIFWICRRCDLKKKCDAISWVGGVLGYRTAASGVGVPSMCQGETKVMSGTARIGVALTSGALFGMVAQAALRHVGLDLATVHGNLIVAAARPGLGS